MATTSNQTASIVSLNHIKCLLSYVVGELKPQEVSCSLQDLGNTLRPENPGSPLYNYENLRVKAAVKIGIDSALDTAMYTVFTGFIHKALGNEKGRLVKLDIKDYLEETKKKTVSYLMGTSYQEDEHHQIDSAVQILYSRLNWGGYHTREKTGETEHVVGQPWKRLIFPSATYKSLDFARHGISEGYNDLVYDQFRNYIYWINRSQASFAAVPYTHTDYYHTTNRAATILRINTAGSTTTLNLFTSSETYIHAIAMNQTTASASPLYVLYSDVGSTTTAERTKVYIGSFNPATASAYATRCVFSGEVYSSGATWIYKPWMDGHFHSLITAYGTRTSTVSNNVVIEVNPPAAYYTAADSCGAIYVVGTGKAWYVPGAGKLLAQMTATTTTNGFNIYIPHDMNLQTNYELRDYDDENKGEEWNKKTSQGVTPTSNYGDWFNTWRNKIFLVPRKSKNDLTWWHGLESIELKPGVAVPRGWYAVVGHAGPNPAWTAHASRLQFIERSNTSVIYRAPIARPQLKVDSANQSYFVKPHKEVGIGVGGSSEFLRFTIQKCSQLLTAETTISTGLGTFSAGIRLNIGEQRGNTDRGLFYTIMYPFIYSMVPTDITEQMVLRFRDFATSATTTVKIVPKDCAFPDYVSDRGDLFYYPQPMQQEYDEWGNETEQPEEGKALQMYSTLPGSRYALDEKFSYEPCMITHNDFTYVARRYVTPDHFSKLGDFMVIQQTPKSTSICDGSLTNMVECKPYGWVFWIDRSGWLWKAKKTWSIYLNMKAYDQNMSVYKLLKSLTTITQHTFTFNHEGDVCFTQAYIDYETSYHTFVITSGVYTVSPPVERSAKLYNAKGIQINLKTYFGETTELKFGIQTEESVKINIDIPIAESCVNCFGKELLALYNEPNKLVEIETINNFKYEAVNDWVQLDIDDYENLDDIYKILGKTMYPKKNTIKWKLLKMEEYHE